MVRNKKVEFQKCLFQKLNKGNRGRITEKKKKKTQLHEEDILFSRREQLQDSLR